MFSKKPSYGSKNKTGYKRPDYRPSYVSKYSRQKASKPPYYLFGLGALAIIVLIGVTLFLVKPFGLFAGRPTQALPAATTAESAQVAVSSSSTIASPGATPTPTMAIQSTFTPAPVLSELTDVPGLQQFLLTLIDDDRKANGLPPVQFDDLSARMGMNHAGEMSQFGYASHLNLDGLGPEARYSFSGGLDAVQENIYSYQFDPGAGPRTKEDWRTAVRAAQVAMMASGEDRKNILDPSHTHVGIGIAYQPSTGFFALTEEFVNRYARIDPILQAVKSGEQFNLSGSFLRGVADASVELDFEPEAHPMTVQQLQNQKEVQSNIRNLQTIPLAVNGSHSFAQAVQLPEGTGRGLIHLRLWATIEGARVLASEIVVRIQ